MIWTSEKCYVTNVKMTNAVHTKQSGLLHRGQGMINLGTPNYDAKWTGTSMTRVRRNAEGFSLLCAHAINRLLDTNTAFLFLSRCPCPEGAETILPVPVHCGVLDEWAYTCAVLYNVV